MLAYVEIVHIRVYLITNLILSIKARTKVMPAKLAAVLACMESDSAQCLPLLDFQKKLIP